MTIKFEGCWQRIKRAGVHRKSIINSWNESLESKQLYSTGVRVERDGAGFIWVRRTPEADALFESIVLELGEFLYQLRAALDACIYNCAIIDSGQDPPTDYDKLEFPMCRCVEDFDKRTFKIAPLDDKRKLLVKNAQPYAVPEIEPHLMLANWNRSLGILHEWARKDRHRKLHVIGSWASNANPLLRVPDAVRIESFKAMGAGFLESDSKVAEFRLSGYLPPMKIQANPNLSIDIALDEGPPPCAPNDTFANRMEAMVIAVTCIVAGSGQRIDMIAAEVASIGRPASHAMMLAHLALA